MLKVRFRRMRVPIAVLLLALAALPARAEIAGEAWAIAGDTLVVGEQLVRLTGVDAPEPEQTCGPKESSWPCGDDAMKALDALVKGREVACTDVTRISDFTVSAHCTIDGQDVGSAMLEQGLAVNRAGAGTAYDEAQAAAQAQGAGIWGGPFMDPEAWRKVHDCSCTARHKAYQDLRASTLSQ